MRSTDRRPISEAPGVYDSPHELFEARARIDHWRRSNPAEAHLSARFDDLVFFEEPLRSLMKRIDIFVRHGGDDLPFKEIDLHHAVTTWGNLSRFYDTSWRRIAGDVRTVYDRTYNDLSAFVEECGALQPHQREIESAHAILGSLISDLVKLGYSYSEIVPQLGRRYYHFGK